MNSTAAIKAFCGERGGLVCTSPTPEQPSTGPLRAASEFLFLPDQHLGRNTAFAMGIPLSEMVVWDPYQINGGSRRIACAPARIILWKGHCSVHQRFLPEHVDEVRAQVSRDSGRRPSRVPLGGLPEGRRAWLDRTDHPNYRDAPAGSISPSARRSIWSTGSQAVRAPGQKSHYARRIRLPVHDDVSHLAAASGLGARKSCGGPRSQSYPGRDDVKHWARVALDRMLAHSRLIRRPARATAFPLMRGGKEPSILPCALDASSRARL